VHVRCASCSKIRRQKFEDGIPFWWCRETFFCVVEFIPNIHERVPVTRDDQHELIGHSLARRSSYLKENSRQENQR